MKRDAEPEWISPMLATLAHGSSRSEDWIVEQKLDGERCLAFREGEGVRMFTRNRRLVNGSYPEIVEALESQALKKFIIDGEVVVLNHGLPSFSRLQERMHVDDPGRARRSEVKVYYYVFDLLYENWNDLRSLPLKSRKELLKKSLVFRGPIRRLPYKTGKGEDFLKEACKKGWEGVIAKRASGAYIERRSTDWLKFKCVAGQEFVIGGYTDPQRTRTGFGALLLGYYIGDSLVYVGKVGTGFNSRILETLGKRLASLEQSGSPFVNYVERARGVHWVKPQLVAQIGFVEITRDGQLRQARFYGLRDDKAPPEVALEAAQR